MVLIVKFAQGREMDHLQRGGPGEGGRRFGGIVPIDAMVQRRAQRDTLIDYEADIMCESNGPGLLALKLLHAFGQCRVQWVSFTYNVVASVGRRVATIAFGAKCGQWLQAIELID